MSETPKTDAVEFGRDHVWVHKTDEDTFVDANFARGLEAALAAKEAELAKAYACIRALSGKHNWNDIRDAEEEHADTIRKAGEEV